MTSPVRHSRLILSAALLLSLAISGPALASDVSAGLKFYNQGKYEEARKSFQRALAANKEDARLHYCLANTLMQQKKVQEALREYHLCVHYGTGTIIAEHSEAAIRAYEQHAVPFDREKALEAESRRKEEQRQRAAELIHKQAEEGANLRTSERESQRNSILTRAGENAKKIRDQAEDEANGLSYTWRRRHWARRTADDIRQQGKADSDAYLKKAQQQAENYDRDARDRQARMYEAESNLNSQMMQPINGSKMRLIPEGTNLYIRNYGR